MLKKYDDQVKTNGYWLGVIDNYVNYKLDFHTNAKAIIEAQTPQSISAFVAEVLKQGNRCEILMMPEEQ